MANGQNNKQAEAIQHFLNDPQYGETWKRILFEAPAYAMERIAISMYHSVFGKTMTPEEKQSYRALREEIEKSLEREDLEYLIKVMPAKQKVHYRALLSVLPQPQGAPAIEQPRLHIPQAQPAPTVLSQPQAQASNPQEQD